jgi:hypothetical protein
VSKRALRRWAPPLAAFGAAVLFLSALALAAGGVRPWFAGAWSRWDSGLYEQIAEHGYDLFRCDGDWCGNAGWFPGYAWVVGVVHRGGLSVVAAAVVVAWVFALATLALVWRIACAYLPLGGAVAALAYAACAPGQVYHYAAFPLSMLACFTLLHLWALERRAWAAAGAAAAAAALVYPLGVTLALVALVWVGATERRRGAPAAALASLPAVLAVALVAAVQRVQTGRWDAYLKVQAKYGHGLHDPFTQTWRSVAAADTKSVQTVVLTVVLATVLVDLAIRWRAAPRLDRLLALWAVVTWAVPLTQANLSLWRSQAALLPLALLVGRLPRALAAAAVVAAAGVAVPMALLFFHNRLI